VLTEQQLRELEDVARRNPGCVLSISPDELFGLVAAARVANAAVRLEREERDMKGWTPCLSADKQAPYDPEHHLKRARADLARALRRYTAGEPQAVKP